jgi:hypothetical protein
MIETLFVLALIFGTPVVIFSYWLIGTLLARDSLRAIWPYEKRRHYTGPDRERGALFQYRAWQWLWPTMLVLNAWAWSKQATRRRVLHSDPEWRAQRIKELEREAGIGR